MAFAALALPLLLAPVALSDYFNQRPSWANAAFTGHEPVVSSQSAPSVFGNDGAWSGWNFGASTTQSHRPESKCDDASSRGDRARPRGFHRVQELALQRSTTSGSAEGVALADFNGDGILDSFLCNSIFRAPPGVPTRADNKPRLLLGTGYSDFRDATETSQIVDGCSSTVAADLDNDGDSDILTNFFRSPTGSCHVYLNDGNASFTELPMAFESCASYPGGFAVGDANNDGFLDVYVSAFNQLGPDQDFVENHFLLGDGTGHFTTLPNSGTEFARFPCDGTFMDLDDDGDADLIVLGCQEVLSSDVHAEVPIPTPLYLYRNSFAQNGVVEFVDASEEYGIGLRNGLWMGSSFGDFNGDGLLDLYVGQAGCPFVDHFETLQDLNTTCDDYKHALLRNNGDGTYTDVADEAQLAEHRWNWGSAFIDVENSGTQDLVTVGNFIAFPLYQFFLRGLPVYNPGMVFLNRNNKLPFEAVEETFDIATGFGLARGDMDGDGLEDLFIQKSGISTPDGTLLESGDAVMLLNTNRDANVWLKVRLEGTTSNRDAIGSKVRIWWRSYLCSRPSYGQCRCGLRKRVQVRAVVAGSSTWSSHDKVITFGLGRRGATVDRIEVQWPNGVKQHVSGYGVKVNSLLDIKEA